MSEKEPRYRRPLFAGIRTSFLAGIVVIAPIAVTMWLVWSFIGWVDGWVLPFVPIGLLPDRFGGLNVHGIGVIIFLLFTVFVGWLAKGILGRSFLHWGERVVDRMPVVRSIYNGLKQIAETVFADRENSFDRACLVEYPRKGIWAIAFISTTAKGEIEEKSQADGPMISIFLPTTPNPTSGFLLFVARDDVIVLDMSVEDAAKLVISAGLVYPNGNDPSQPPDYMPEP